MKSIFYVLSISFLFLVLTSCQYDLPEGTSRKVHNYDEVTSYIQEYLNSNEVVVSTSYEDGIDEYDKKYRMWDATYNSIEFVITSQEETYFDTTGEFAISRYTLENNYNYNFIKHLYEEQSSNFPNISLEYQEKGYLNRYNICYFTYKFVVNNEEDVTNAFNDAKKLYIYIIDIYPEARFSVRLPYEETMQHHVYLDSFKRDHYENSFGFTDEALERAISDFSRYSSS